MTALIGGLAGAAAFALGWICRWVWDGALILRFNRESYERGRADERRARALPDDHAGHTDQLDSEPAAPAVLAVPVPPPAPETLAMPDDAGTDLPGRRADEWEAAGLSRWEPGQLAAMREEIVAEGGYADFSSRLSAFVSEREQWLADRRAELADDRRRLGLEPFTVYGQVGKLLTAMTDHPYPGGRHARPS